MPSTASSPIAKSGNSTSSTSSNSRKKRTRRTMLKNGDRAPDFTLKSVDGQPVGLADLLNRGQLLLAFFKISCPTCQYALPFLNRLRSENVVSVSQDDAVATREFNNAFQVTVPTLLDSARQHYPVSNAYGLTNVPAFYLIEPIHDNHNSSRRQQAQ